MTILSSKQRKRDGVIDPVFILLFGTLILLMFFAVFTGDVDVSVNNVLEYFGDIPTRMSLTSQPSFAVDQQYWEAYCSHGWSSDAICETIASRSQSCSISADSAYCSEYANYLQQYRKK